MFSSITISIKKVFLVLQVTLQTNICRASRYSQLIVLVCWFRL